MRPIAWARSPFLSRRLLALLLLSLRLAFQGPADHAISDMKVGLTKPIEDRWQANQSSRTGHLQDSKGADRLHPDMLGERPGFQVVNNNAVRLKLQRQG